jgi:hypothetical protein
MLYGITPDEPGTTQQRRKRQKGQQMKKKQYTTKQKAALAARIIRKAVEISNTTPHDVFVGYSPHVDLIEVRMFEGGWKRDSFPDKELRVYFDLEYNDPETEAKDIMDALAELQKDAKK